MCLQYLFDNQCKNGNENDKIYCTVKCSSGGLVMTKICEILIVLMWKMTN